MREYKFRGKRVDNDEWVYGGYVKDEHNNAHMIFTNELGAYNAGFRPKREDCVLNYYEVDPETIGQYTEKNDKNGVEIYEGSEIKCKNYHGEVEGTVSYNNSYYYLACSSGYSDEYLLNCSDIKVIGNIHDNNNLLEVDQ